MMPLSPAPVTPSGLRGVGLSLRAMSKRGTSGARLSLRPFPGRPVQGQQRKPGGAVSQRRHGVLVADAYNRVALPVHDPGFLLDDFRMHIHTTRTAIAARPPPWRESCASCCGAGWNSVPPVPSMRL